MKTLVRPNGKTYRRRKPLEVAEVVSADTMTGVVVLGTHDLDLAHIEAANLINAYELSDVTPSLDWLRLVPWDPSGCFERSYITDTVRGTPCVVWYPNA